LAFSASKCYNSSGKLFFFGSIGAVGKHGSVVGSGGWSGTGDGLPGQLYDMEADLDESNNLYENPDHQSIIQGLKTLLEQYKSQGYSRPLS